MKIEIQNAHVDEFSGTSNRTGRPFTIRKQEAWAHLPGEPYPRAISIPLGREQSPYAPGTYALDPKSFFVDKFGSLSLRPSLTAAKVA